MKATPKAAMTSIGILLLWASLAMGVEGQSGVPDSVRSGSGKQEGQLWESSPCAGCFQEKLRPTPPAPLARASSLPTLGEVVGRQVALENVSPRYPRLWFNSEDPLFAVVTAKRSLFKENMVSSWRQEPLLTFDGFLELWAW